MTLVTFRCALTGESQTEVLCERCAADLAPLADPHPADDDIECTTCPRVPGDVA